MFATPSSWAESAFRLPLLLCLLTTTGGTADGATAEVPAPNLPPETGPSVTMDDPELTSSRRSPVTKSLDFIGTAFQGGAEFTLLDAPATLRLSARTTRALLYGDNGTDQELFVVANSFSSTRIAALFEVALSESLHGGISLKVPLLLDSSLSVDFGDGTGNFSFGQFDNEREWDLFVRSLDFGRIYLGFGSTASDGSSEIDLSGSTVVASSRSRDMAGGLSFDHARPRIKEVINNYDGLGDRSRARYDTPAVNGMVASTSVTVEGDLDVALNYRSGRDDAKMAAAIAYVHTKNHQISGSCSLLTADGISATVAAAVRFGDGASLPLIIYTKLAYRRRYLSLGESVFGVDFTYKTTASRSAAIKRSITAFSAFRHSRSVAFSKASTFISPCATITSGKLTLTETTTLNHLTLSSKAALCLPRWQGFDYSFKRLASDCSYIKRLHARGLVLQATLLSYMVSHKPPHGW